MGISHRVDEEPGGIEFGSERGELREDPVLAARAREIDPEQEARKEERRREESGAGRGAVAQPSAEGESFLEEDERIAAEDVQRLTRQEREEKRREGDGQSAAS